MESQRDSFPASKVFLATLHVSDLFIIAIETGGPADIALESYALMTCMWARSRKTIPVIVRRKDIQTDETHYLITAIVSLSGNNY